MLLSAILKSLTNTSEVGWPMVSNVRLTTRSTRNCWRTCANVGNVCARGTHPWLRYFQWLPRSTKTRWSVTLSRRHVIRTLLRDIRPYQFAEPQIPRQGVCQHLCGWNGLWMVTKSLTFKQNPQLLLSMIDYRFNYVQCSPWSRDQTKEEEEEIFSGLAFPQLSTGTLLRRCLKGFWYLLLIKVVAMTCIPAHCKMKMSVR